MKGRSQANNACVFLAHLLNIDSQQRSEFPRRERTKNLWRSTGGVLRHLPFHRQELPVIARASPTLRHALLYALFTLRTRGSLAHFSADERAMTVLSSLRQTSLMPMASSNPQFTPRPGALVSLNPK